ncbi:MAG: hypothetical protein IRY99_25720, partial [Isosphaeraceae bacterium]|nr:hypothetical protein [Isosphaeraceae bacterium]
PQSQPPAPLPTPTPSPVGKARVLVQVPNSYYWNCARSLDPTHRPSKDDLSTLEARTKETIREAVQHVIPEEDLAELTISRVGVPEPERPEASAPESVARRPPPWWPAAAAAATVATLAVAALASRRLAARRPTAPLAHRPHLGPYGPGPAATGPGPSERVRELVRANPEAAAGVLHRWIASGGPPP